MSRDYLNISDRLSALAVFRGALDDGVLSIFKDVIGAMALEQTDPKDTELYTDAITAGYGKLVSAVYDAGGNISKHLLKLVLEDENVYVKKAAKGEAIPAEIKAAVKNELELFEEISRITSADVRKFMRPNKMFPAWKTSKIDFAKEYEANIKDISKRGYGIYARHCAFAVKASAEEEGKAVIVPISHPDPQTLDSLYGYEREREKIIKNTEALLYRGGCNNMLLYGDAGTGKSSTIKAVANEYAGEGLRIIELKKNQLFMIPDIIDQLSDLPLKFILFIDDLSFNKNDDNFSALKAILEGSITSAGDNVAVYATSNRRHLVKENLSDREGDEVHVNDTLQETASLSARFGLNITFQRPEKDAYLEIVEKIAKEEKLKTDRDELFRKAEAFAIRANGRTPRAAKQFIMSMKIGL